MKCPKCQLVEMIVEKVIDNTVEYKCRKCGTTKTEDLKDINVEKK